MRSNVRATKWSRPVDAADVKSEIDDDELMEF